MIALIIKVSTGLLTEMWISVTRQFASLICIVCLSLACLLPAPAFAAENKFIDAIQQRGYLNVGIPPYNTPPAYYLDPDTKQLKGYDIDLARGLADKVGVDDVLIEIQPVSTILLNVLVPVILTSQLENLD